MVGSIKVFTGVKLRDQIGSPTGAWSKVSGSHGCVAPGHLSEPS